MERPTFTQKTPIRRRHTRLLDTPNDDAQTPLHLAVETAQWRIARWLIVAGARPCPRDIRGDSPLHIAARGGDVKSVKAIADPVQQQERDALALGYQGHMYQPCDLDQWNYLGEFVFVCFVRSKGAYRLDIVRANVREHERTNTISEPEEQTWQQPFSFPNLRLKFAERGLSSFDMSPFLNRANHSYT
ncbi:hypothetical protein NQ318_010483 [Aromia moschata]|uniref:Uncharacterized protein n=1 Tax=Aromia moschata TaxID=1265417 RepID=A0AAV8Y9N4_9CUCU|nr:hypothetical protein NQ318_010483 [Aromia moschata]